MTISQFFGLVSPNVIAVAFLFYELTVIIFWEQSVRIRQTVLAGKVRRLFRLFVWLWVWIIGETVLWVLVTITVNILQKGRVNP